MGPNRLCFIALAWGNCSALPKNRRTICKSEKKETQIYFNMTNILNKYCCLVPNECMLHNYLT